MKKKIVRYIAYALMGFVIGATLACLASMPAKAATSYQAECPTKMVELERQFWMNAVTEVEVGAHMKMEMECLVYRPALTADEFKNMAMIMKYFTLYPDVVRPWEMDNGALVIIRANATTAQFEFIKVMYSPATGNLFLSKATVYPKVD